MSGRGTQGDTETASTPIGIYDKLLDPQVRGVEVTCDNGGIVKAESTAEGLCAEDAEAHAVRELRALDAQGNVLQRYNIPNAYEIARW